MNQVTTTTPTPPVTYVSDGALTVTGVNQSSGLAGWTATTTTTDSNGLLEGVFLALLLCHGNNLPLWWGHGTDCLLSPQLIMPVMSWSLHRWASFSELSFCPIFFLVLWCLPPVFRFRCGCIIGVSTIWVCIGVIHWICLFLLGSWPMQGVHKVTASPLPWEMGASCYSNYCSPAIHAIWFSIVFAAWQIFTWFLCFPYMLVKGLPSPVWFHLLT